MHPSIMARRSNIIWLGDTNYRIDLDNASVRVYAEDDALDMLLAADQLTYVMSTGVAFSGYVEGPILFRPTYRYDIGTDNYDTSEKMRIPAWTGSSLFPHLALKGYITCRRETLDRVLFRGNKLDLSVYSRAELRGSDHRPGMFTFASF
jgi:hypothetical protein